MFAAFSPDTQKVTELWELVICKAAITSVTPELYLMCAFFFFLYRQQAVSACFRGFLQLYFQDRRETRG